MRPCSRALGNQFADMVAFSAPFFAHRHALVSIQAMKLAHLVHVLVSSERVRRSSSILLSMMMVAHAAYTRRQLLPAVRRELSLITRAFLLPRRSVWKEGYSRGEFCQFCFVLAPDAKLAARQLNMLLCWAARVTVKVRVLVRYETVTVRLYGNSVRVNIKSTVRYSSYE